MDAAAAARRDIYLAKTFSEKVETFCLRSEIIRPKLSRYRYWFLFFGVDSMMNDASLPLLGMVQIDIDAPLPQMPPIFCDFRFSR